MLKQTKQKVEDITDELKALAPDIIIGGPPCQDFSIAGKLNLTGNRANLTRIYSHIIADVRPQWFVMENVYTIERSPIFAEALETFKNAGYGITKHVWDASYMGVPQMRKRYFVIGCLGKDDDFMLQPLLDGLSKERMTVRKYFGGNFDSEYIYQHPRNYKRRGIFSIDEPCSTIRSVNRPIPSNYTIHPADKSSDLSKVRPLTTKERSYMQTFPESFVFVGNHGAIEQAIGNAVPIKMAEYVAKHIISQVNQSKLEISKQGFITLLSQGVKIVKEQVENEVPYTLSVSINCTFEHSATKSARCCSYPINKVDEIWSFINTYPSCDFECDIYIEVEGESPERSEVMIVKERNILSLHY